MGQYWATKHRYNISFKEDTKVLTIKDGKSRFFDLSLVPFHEKPTTNEDEIFLIIILKFFF